MLLDQSKNHKRPADAEQTIQRQREQAVRRAAVWQEAHFLMQKHGLTRQGWRFRFDHARVRAGQCSYAKKFISISRHFATNASRAEVTDTLLHEIAHALTPNHGHDRVWRSVALELGCNGQRCHSSRFMKARYIQQCSNRCWQREAHRKRKNLVCRYCGAKVIYTLNGPSERA